MMQMINKLLDWFKSLFWKEEMELTLVGLQHAGKTTFVNVIASGQVRARGAAVSWGGFLKIISVGVMTYAGMKTSF